MQTKKSRAPRIRRRDPNEPTRPQNAYNLFFKGRVLEFKAANPDGKPGLGEYNRVIGSEWTNLTDEDKKPFQQRSKIDRERYAELMKEYKKTDAYKDFIKLSKKKDAEAKQKKAAAIKKQKEAQEMDNFDEEQSNGFTVPIFTHEFLEHNKLRETTFRQLKKQVICLEEETALLSKHVETLESAVTEANTDTAKRSESITQLEHELTNLYGNISEALADIPLPDTRIRITPGNVHDYLEAVCGMVATGKHLDFVGKVKKILNEVDLD